MAIATLWVVTPLTLLILNPIIRTATRYAINGIGSSKKLKVESVSTTHAQEAATIIAGTIGRRYGNFLCFANVEALHIP